MKFEGEFDFETANARFKKDEVEEEMSKKLDALQVSEGDNQESPCQVRIPAD